MAFWYDFRSHKGEVHDDQANDSSLLFQQNNFIMIK